MRPIQTPAHSYRAERLPPFDEARILLVMDGDCALCSAGAQYIARLDRKDRVRITTSQSDLGRGLLSHYALDPDQPETWLLIADGQAVGSLDAMIRLFSSLHWGFIPLRLLSVLPTAVRDWLYARVARNRYALFGRGDICALPDPELRRRLVSMRRDRPAQPGTIGSASPASP